MKVKTKQELLDLDEELNLFDETDWNFLNVQDGVCLEYFNDIVDDDFKKRSILDVLRYTLIVLSVCCILTVSGVWLYRVTVGRNLSTLSDVNATNDVIVKLKRVENASGVSDEDYIEISKVISSYFNVLRNGNSYDILNNFCLSSSTFYNTEKLYREKMIHSYDSNDCYSRALRCFGTYFTVSKINEVLYKDGTYYIYANLNYPDNNALTEYFYVYANDMTKFFTSNEITEQNMVRYIVNLADTYGIPSSSSEICIEMYKNDSGEFVFIDDSFVTNKCTTAYNYAISQVIRVLGINKATTQYDN